MKTCSIQECQNKHKAFGYCDKHYQRYKKHNDPLIAHPKKRCSAAGCNNTHYGLGYCDKHYQRLKKHNNINHVRQPKFNTLEEAFNAEAIRKDQDECWGWSGKTDKQYGVTRFKINDRYERAHRASYLLHIGQIPKGLFVCHKCDNPICTNPSHLFLGTNLDNIRDCVNKNRQAKGKMLKHTTIDEAIAKQIKALINSGSSMAKIARDLGVSYNVVRGIKENRTWKHI